MVKFIGIIVRINGTLIMRFRTILGSHVRRPCKCTFIMSDRAMKMLGPIAQGSPVEPDISLMIVQLTYI